MMLLYLVILLIFNIHLVELAKDHSQCVQELKGRSKFVSDRYSQKQLESICAKNDYWKTAAKEKKPSKILTSAQAEYVNSVRKCKGHGCLQKVKGQSKKIYPSKSKNKFGILGKGIPLNSSTLSPAHSATIPISMGGGAGIVTTPQPYVVVSAKGVGPRNNDTSNIGETTTPNTANHSSVTTSASYTYVMPNQTLPYRRNGRQSGFGYPVTRKEYRMMTAAERQKYQAAVNILKTDTIDGVPKYDLLVQDHLPSAAPEAHWGCSFLPYHREFLKQMEVALRLEDPDVFLPYWDSTLDQGLPAPCDSVMWSDIFIGNPRGLVTSGPFANWVATQPAPGQNGNQLYRSCSGQADDLYHLTDLDYFMTFSYFEQHNYCVDPTFEIAHGLVHDFVGGHMAYINLSPNDPVFFLHHTFIDELWEEWRQAVQTYQQRPTDYCPDANACGAEYTGNAPMYPFSGYVNTDGLSNDYTDQLYNYDPRPSCPDNCPGPYLFCNGDNPARCLSKINAGGNCAGLGSFDACYYGNCVNDQCVSV